jgi:hypothetical protein
MILIFSELKKTINFLLQTFLVFLYLYGFLVGKDSAYIVGGGGRSHFQQHGAQINVGDLSTFLTYVIHSLWHSLC